MGRRIVSKIYDIIIFVLIALVCYFPLDGYIYQHELPNIYYLGIYLLIFVIFLVVFGLIPKKIQATIGQKIEKLVIVPTKGKITFFRVFLKELVSFIPFIPLVVFIVNLVLHDYKINITIMVIAIAFILVECLLNWYLYNKFSQSFTDRLFDIKIILKKRKSISINDFKDYNKSKEE